MTGLSLPASMRSLRTRRSARFGETRNGRRAWLTNRETSVRADDAAAAREPALLERPAVRHERAGRGERPSKVGQRVVGDVVEDEVVLPSAAGEVVAGVVDDVVGADRADEVHVPRAAHAGDLGAERLRDLHGERADPARGTVDEHRLAGLDVALVAQRLEGDEPGQRDRGRLLEGEVRPASGRARPRPRRRSRRTSRRTSRRPRRPAGTA